MDEQSDVLGSLQRELMVDKGSREHSEDISNPIGGSVDFRAALLKKPLENKQADCNWSDDDLADDIDLDDFETEDVDIPDGVPNLSFTEQEQKNLWKH